MIAGANEAKYEEFRFQVNRNATLEREMLEALAQHPNLTIKLPGFGEICELPYPFQEVPEAVRDSLEAFGPERVMWGSDFPPVSTREGYHHSLDFPLQYLADLSEQDREWIFGGAALKVWGFRGE